MSRFESMANNDSKGLDVRGSERGPVIGNNASKEGIETKSTTGTDKGVPLRSCFASKVVVGKDGRPMKAGRCGQFDYLKETLDNQRANEGNTTNGVKVDRPIGSLENLNKHDMNHVASSVELSVNQVTSTTINDNVMPETNAALLNDTSNSGESVVHMKSDSTGKTSIEGYVQEKLVKIVPLTNDEVIEGAHVTLPLATAKEVSNRFLNTLYGYFIGKRLAFPIVENYVKNAWAKYGIERVMLQNGFFFFQFSSKDGMDKVLENGPWLIRLVPFILYFWTPTSKLKRDEITTVPLWVKLHNVPIVAYSEIGLSLLTTQLAKPIMLDGYTSNMCVNSWGRNSYARALIEVSTAKELMESIVMAIPIDDGARHTLETIEVEYEWQPPRCATCKIFEHNDDKCPKKPKEVHINQQRDDGFKEVTRKKGKGKHHIVPKTIAGIRLTKPKPNFVYQQVNKQASKNDVASTSQPVGLAKEDNVVSKNTMVAHQMPSSSSGEVTSDFMVLKNSFAALDDVETTTGTHSESNIIFSNDSDHCELDSDNEVMKNIIMEEPQLMGGRTKSNEMQGASTPSNEGHDV
ncbi:zinc knuckle CX2CX4HX4C containing protein [Tanacetum coccineum]